MNRRAPFFLVLFSLALLLAACKPSAPAGSSGALARATAYTEGDTAAPVKFIYFDDLVCDDCKRFSTAAAEPIRTQWIANGKLHLTVVDLAWHRGSVAGSAAAVCAAEQGKFWEMHEMLFARQDTWKRATNIPAALNDYAGELALDRAKFSTCAAKKEHQHRLDAAEDAAREVGVRGTPAFVVNGKAYFGAQDWGWLEQVLTAYANGTPDAAPPPPMAIPTKKVVDSVRLKVLQDSVAKARLAPGR